MRFMSYAVAAGLAMAFTVSTAQAADLSGAGATFPYPIYAKWADAYKKETGIGLNYQSIGSGGGIKQIENKTVTFGASDKPLPGEELDKYGLAQFPWSWVASCPSSISKASSPARSCSTADTVAKIFMGEITKWDDAAHQEAQPGRQTSLLRDCRRAPLRRIGHHLQLHLLPV